MCLTSKLTKREFMRNTVIESHKKNPGLLIGWKAIKITKTGNLYSPHFYKKGNSLKVNSWINEEDVRIKSLGNWIIDDHNNCYRKGFHIFISFIDALHYAYLIPFPSKVKIIKVYFNKEDIVAYGSQSSLKVIVSKFILIPKQYPRTINNNKYKKRI
jgi:hypothetical protein